jgi:hypothetical protein
MSTTIAELYLAFRRTSISIELITVITFIPANIDPVTASLETHIHPVTRATYALPPRLYLALD